MRGIATRRAVATPLLAAALLGATPARAEDLGPAPAARCPRRAAPAPLAPIRAPDPWLGRDKALHFAASAALAGGGYGVGALALDDVPSRVVLGAGVALGASLAKEALDAAGLGTPSWRDLAWDLLGTSLGLGLSLAVDLAVRPGRFH